MEFAILLLAFLLMLVGMVGVLIPVLPGLAVVWLVGVITLLWQDLDGVGWAVSAWLTLLLVLGTLATVWFPARRGREAGAPSSTFAAAVFGAVVGFFVLPVLGFLFGALAGLLLAERSRLGDWPQARSSTLEVLRAYGVGVAVELLLGVVMVGSWLVAVVVRFG